MKGSRASRAVLWLAALLVLGYFGLQGFRLFYAHCEIETVLPYVVEETSKISGLVLREEIVLPDRIGDGVAAYTAANGSKVTEGSPLAEIYRSQQDALTVSKLRDLEQKKQQLLKAQDPGTTAFAHTDVLNRQIISEIGALVEQVDAGALGQLPSSSDKLLLLMNTKQIATGKQTDYNSAIQSIEAQESFYRSHLQTTPSILTAPRYGYFIHQVDGLEGAVEWDEVDNLTPLQVSELLRRPVKEESTILGKLMTDHHWYFVSLIPMEKTAKFREGRSVTLNFRISGLDPVPATIRKLNIDKETEQAAVIFESDYINETIVTLRNAKADVNFKSISGLRVSRSALRFEGMQQGVYVVRGDNMVFMPVEVIYEDAGFVLCREVDVSDSAAYDYSLQQFDEVVVKGRSLYDGKPLK